MKIRLEKNELQEFYERAGTNHFKLQSKVSKAYGDRTLQIYFKLVEFTKEIVTVTGVVAGFGFTGLSSVEHTKIFCLGEALLFIGILFGIYFIHNVFAGELHTLKTANETHREYFKARNDLFKKVWEDLNNQGAEENDLKSLIKKDAEVLTIFENSSEDTGWLDKIRSKQRILMYLVGAGSYAIILSLIR